MQNGGAATISQILNLPVVCVIATTPLPLTVFISAFLVVQHCCFAIYVLIMHDCTKTFANKIRCSQEVIRVSSE